MVICLLRGTLKSVTAVLRHLHSKTDTYSIDPILAENLPKPQWVQEDFLLFPKKFSRLNPLYLLTYTKAV